MKKILAIAVGALLAVNVRATNYTNWVGGASGGLPQVYAGQVYDIPNTLTITGNGYSTNDTVEVITLPTNAVVLGVSATVDAALPNAITFDVGDGDSATLYVNGASATNPVATWSISAITPTVTPTLSKASFANAATNVLLSITYVSGITNQVMALTNIEAGPATNIYSVTTNVAPCFTTWSVATNLAAILGTASAVTNATATSSSVTAGSKLYPTGGTLKVTFHGLTGTSGQITVRAIALRKR